MKIGFDFDGTIHSGDLTARTIIHAYRKKNKSFAIIFYRVSQILNKLKILSKGEDLNLTLRIFPLTRKEIIENIPSINWLPLKGLLDIQNQSDVIIISGCLDIILKSLFKEIQCFGSVTSINDRNYVQVEKFFSFYEKREIAKKEEIDIYFGDKKGDKLVCKNTIIIK